MTTARDICNSILRKLHVLGQGQIVSDNELNDVLDNVNDMLATWSVEGCLVYTESSDTFSLTGNQEVYTIGSGQDFDTDRILSINSAYVTQTNIDYTITEYDQAEYANITQKNSGGIPEIYYYDSNFPVARIYLYPVPSSVTSISLNTTKELTSFANLDTVYAMPNEYKAAIIYNGAIWCASEYEKEPDRTVANLANRTKKSLQTQNKRNRKNVSYLDIPVGANRYSDESIYRGY